MRWLTFDQVMMIHRKGIERFGGLDGIRDSDSVKSAIAYPFQTLGGQEIFPDLFDKVGALGWMLCRHHPFNDGNKRVAHATMEVALAINGYALMGEWLFWERTMVDLAAGEIDRDRLVTFVRSYATKLIDS